MQKEQHFLSQQEGSFLNALAFVRRVAAFKLRGTYGDAAEDIVQRVSLNLWRWNCRIKESATEKSVVDFQSQTDESIESTQTETEELSRDEWLRLANTSVRNEISSFFRSKYRREAILAESSLENAARKTCSQWRILEQTSNLEGNSRAEIASLLCRIWKITQEFSLRQKYSFLLQKEEMIINLLSHGCCKRQEIAEALALDKSEFDTVLISLPLSDEDICSLLEKKTGTRLTLRQIWMARAKAKARLADKLKPLI